MPVRIRLSSTSALLILFLFAGVVSAQADEPLSQRRLFLEAEKAMKEGDLTQYHQLKRQLLDYPLLPYLESEELTHHLETQSPSAVRGFLERYDDSPSAFRLRKEWLSYLAQQGRWAEVVSDYKPTNHREMRCQRLMGLLETGQAAKAYEEVGDVWRYAGDLPEACKAPIERIYKAGRLTPELVWQRMDLVRDKASEERTNLMRQLKSYLPANDHGYHELWMQSQTAPAKVLASPLLQKNHVSRGPLLVHVIDRLASQDPVAAIAALRNRAEQLDDAQQKRLELEIGQVLSRRNHVAAMGFFGSIKGCGKQYGLCELRIRQAVLERDWDKVIRWSDDLPERQRQHEKWGYWKARALESMGRQSEAQALFKLVATDRSYYGFLAADRINAPYRLDHQPVPISADEHSKLASQPGFQRAREMYRLGREYEAGTEWTWATKDLDNKGLMGAALLAKEWGWSGRAILTLLPTDYWDDLEIRFPLTHRDKVDSWAKEYGINNAWVFAIMRQESSFVEDAQSPVGALGLMQLMPKTARSMASKLGMPHLGSTDILKPDNNIRLGSRYLKELYDQFNGWVILATPSYNAGPHRTNQWLGSKPVPADLWLESIPIEETRLYVQRVLSYLALYEYRLGRGEVRLRDLMPEISRDLPKSSPPPRSSGAVTTEVPPEKKVVTDRPSFNPLDL